MSVTVLLHVGVSGLVLGDLAPRLYSGNSRQAAPAWALGAIGDGTVYRLTGLPNGVGGGPHYTLTAAYDGIGYAHRWGGSGSPSVVIAPFRVAGLVLGDLDPVAYVDAAVWSAGALSVVELGSGAEPGDYAISGYPVAAAGEDWELTWQLEGVIYRHGWQGRVTVTPGTMASYQANDYAAVRAVMLAIDPTDVIAVAGTGWIGIYSDNEIIDPAPPVSADRSNPTIFARWTLEMTSPPSATLDGDAAPYREGVVRMAVMYQMGAGRGPALRALTVMRQALIDASAANLRAYLVDQATSQMQLPRAGWQIEELRVPFRGV